MAKNFNNISDNLIDDNDLLRLDIHILVPGYLKKERPYFTDITTKNNNEENEDAKEPEVSNFEEEKKKQRTLWKKKRDMQATARLAIARLSSSLAELSLMHYLFALYRLSSPMCVFSALMPMPGLSASSISSLFTVSVFESYTTVSVPATAVSMFRSPAAVLVLGLSAFFVSAMPMSGFSTTVLVPGLFASFVSIMLLFGFSATILIPSSFLAFSYTMPVFGSSTTMPIPNLSTSFLPFIPVFRSSATVPIFGLSAFSALAVYILRSSTAMLMPGLSTLLVSMSVMPMP